MGQAKRHHPDAVASRDEKTEQRIEKQVLNSPISKLIKAGTTIRKQANLLDRIEVFLQGRLLKLLPGTDKDLKDVLEAIKTAR